MSKEWWVPCACGGRKSKCAVQCRACRYPNAGAMYECPSCGGPKSFKAAHCKFCWGVHDRSATRKGPRRINLDLTSGVDEALDLLSQSWALGRAQVVYRLVLAAARQTERELRRDKVA